MSTKEFGKMKSEEQKDLVQKIGAVLNENGLGETDVTIEKRVQYNLRKKEVELAVNLIVKKEAPVYESEKVDTVNKALEPLLEGISGCEVLVRTMLAAGDSYKAIQDVMAFKAKETVNLEHKEGEVWLVDFWAKSCELCFDKLVLYQGILDKRAKDWGSNVRIIGISLDQDNDNVEQQCEENKLMSIEHYHQNQSNCIEVYSVNQTRTDGLPHVMIIDKQGKIAFMGNPAKREDLEKDFDALLNGETLTGQGCGPNAQAEEPGAKADIPAGFKEQDMTEQSSEIDTLIAVFEGLAKDEEIQKSTQDFIDARSILDLQLRYSPKTDSFIGRFVNLRVVMGPKENVDKIQGIFDEKVKGSFVVNNNNVIYTDQEDSDQ